MATCLLMLLPWLLLGLRVVFPPPTLLLPPTGRAAVQLDRPRRIPPPLNNTLIKSVAPFQADSAWQEFTTLLRGHYAYFTRPGVDGEAILTAFAPRAKAAPTPAAFRDVLQLVAHNFADPHFIVGPLDSADYNVVPTSADLVGRYRPPLRGARRTPGERRRPARHSPRSYRAAN